MDGAALLRGGVERHAAICDPELDRVLGGVNGAFRSAELAVQPGEVVEDADAAADEPVPADDDLHGLDLEAEASDQADTAD